MKPRDVYPFPPSSTFTVQQALASAGQLPLTDVVIVGVSDTDTLVIRSSRMSRAEALWLIEHARDASLKP